jgi:hypothetical protein
VNELWLSCTLRPFFGGVTDVTMATSLISWRRSPISWRMSVEREEPWRIVRWSEAEEIVSVVYMASWE